MGMDHNIGEKGCVVIGPNKKSILFLLQAIEIRKRFLLAT